jgi:ferrochelatase
VRPFLENLFKDPAIISLPAIARIPLAKFIAARRAKMARANYAIMGGGSPLLPETLKQAQALETSLNEADPSRETRVYVAMRYWKPFAAQTAKDVAAFAPDEVVLLPLYPQFSTTTTGSSVNDWAQVYTGPGRTHTVCCYPTEPGLTDAHAKLIRQTWEQAGSPTNVRLLFSAHGLPEKVIEAGDPYQAQIQATAQAVAMRLPELTDWNVCYQSRVGRLKWIGPSTDDEIRRAGAEGKGVLICPIAFVSEHVETLVELDHEYAELADQVGCAPYLRASTPSTEPAFIRALTRATNQALARNSEVAPHGAWRCPETYSKCACRNGASGAAA